METLTKERIAAIVGRLSAERVTEILESGADKRELLEARMLAQQQERPHTPRPELRSAVVNRLYDTLRADEIEPHER